MVRVHRDAVVAVWRADQAEMHRIFNLGRLVEPVAAGGDGGWGGWGASTNPAKPGSPGNAGGGGLP
jgi:hypothetical protein